MPVAYPSSRTISLVSHQRKKIIETGRDEKFLRIERKKKRIRIFEFSLSFPPSFLYFLSFSFFFPGATKERTISVSEFSHTNAHTRGARGKQEAFVGSALQRGRGGRATRFGVLECELGRAWGEGRASSVPQISTTGEISLSCPYNHRAPNSSARDS